MKARPALRVVATVALCCVFAAQRGFAAPAGGAAIVNAVSATYADAASHVYQTSSNAIVATVASLSSVVVSPKEASANASADGVPVASTVTRTFTITNTSNIPDAYQIDKLSAGTLAISKVVWITSSGSIATRINGSTSPAVAPNASISAQVTISTNGMTIGQSVAIQFEAHTTVTGTQNGIAADSGQQWLVGTSGPHLVGPAGANTLVSKTVNESSLVQSQPGSSVQFQIAAKNAGGSAATNVKISDPVPAGLAIDLSSATIDGQPAGAQASVSGQTITFVIPQLDGGVMLNVAFRASLPPGNTLGQSFVNVASISADGIPAQGTTPADVFDGSADIVFDGYAGGSHPVGGATVALLDAAGNPVNLASATPADRARMASAAQSGTTNPVVTTNDGTYGFALSASAIPSQGARYYLTIAAPGYLNRRIAVDVAPAAHASFYNVTQTSVDGQPLAMAGGFTLTKNNVSIQDVFGLFGNLPLFAQSTIVVSKTSDKQAASAGDRVMYSLQFQDQSAMAFNDVAVVDTMPAGLVYLRGTARLDGDAIEPRVEGRTLTWDLSSLAPSEQHTIAYAATIFGDIAPGSTLTNQVAVSGTGSSGGVRASGSSSATVTVLGGPFSARRVVAGRVFFDDAKTGTFAKGDRVAAGVRVFMEDGSFALTDVNGAFSFPAVRPGMHALRLDPLSLPANALVASDAPMTSPYSLERLLHGILDDATMEDVEFALEPKS